MSKRRDKDRATAYHEAGHAVMGWIQQVRLKRASIVAEKDSAGHCLHEKLLRFRTGELSDTPRAKDWQEKYILICMAGGVAQRLFNPRSVRRYHSQTDWKQAVEVALGLNGGDSKAIELYLKWLLYRAKKLITFRQHWLLIEAVARELLRKRELTRSEVEAVIRKSYDDQLRRSIAARKIRREKP